MNILLIRLRLIGDVVFTTPIPRALKRVFPGAHLTYLVEPAAAPVVARNPSVDDLMIVPRRRGAQRVVDDMKLAWRLRRGRFDLVIDLHGGPRSSWLAFATGAPQRIGYAIKGRTWMYTTAVARPRELRARHSVVNQWDLLEAIRLGPDDARRCGGTSWPGGAADPVRNRVEMPLDPAADTAIGRRLEAAGVTSEHELVVAHVSAGNPFRRWPEPHFTKVLTTLAAAGPQRRIIVSSGPSDREAADRITAAAREVLGTGAARIVAFGEFDLAELRALIGRSRLFVGGDTGPLHIAATTSTPVVGLYGPTLPERSAPWRDPAIPTISLGIEGLPCRPCEQRVCEPGDFRCLTTLRPEDVISAAEQALQWRRPPNVSA
ncbi:MAG: glycosyltransferase family 9 protein [Acidobacteria bacterium]|nr:glycosyltransferase family 9 protein [Acidobacteriota bacterium]